MRPRDVGLGLLLMAGGSVLQAESRSSSCHIHPPGSTPQDPVNIVGPFASVAECETERRRRFRGMGRCHCQADFTPRWYPTDPVEGSQREPSELL